MNTFISKLTISLQQSSTKTVAKVWDVWRRGWGEVAVIKILLVKFFYFIKVLYEQVFLTRFRVEFADEQFNENNISLDNDCQ